MGKEVHALWGESNEEGSLNTRLLDFIRKKVGLDRDQIIWSGNIEAGDLPVSSELKELLLGSISQDNISFDPSDRLKHSIGMGGLDYIRIMEKRGNRIVDAVVYPTEEEIKHLLAMRDKKLEIIPYGGGTTVTGGITPSGQREFSVSLDTARLNSINIDSTNNILEAGTGLKGPQIEDALQKYNLTLGNFPESFSHSTLGGWIATNAAGQESNRYGKIKDMIIGLKMESTSGTYSDRIIPGESAFFKLSDIAVGSEGAFGIVTKAWLKLHRKPERLYYRSYMFRTFEEGMESLRREFVANKNPIVARLSDVSETELSLIGTGDGFATNLFKKYVSLRMHHLPGALLIVVSDSMDDMNFSGGINLGSVPSKYWYRERFSRPFIYNELLKRGIVAETIETSANWDKLGRIYRTSRKKFEETVQSLDIKGMILCHSSHQYVTGSALYFTFLFYANENRASYLQTIRDEILKNIILEGGSISHHHGIGIMQSAYLKDYKGEFYKLIQQVKSFLDPDNSLNPEVLKS